MKVLMRRPGRVSEVMDGADHRPFALHLLDSPQEELAEPSRLLDLSEYRLDHLLAQAVAAAMAGAPEPAGHPGEKRAGFGRPLRGSGLTAVLLSSGCDVAFDPSPAQRAKIGGRAVILRADCCPDWSR